MLFPCLGCLLAVLYLMSELPIRICAKGKKDVLKGYVTPAGACVDGGTEVWQYGICFIDSNSSGTCRHATGTHFFATARIATDPRGDSECYFSITSDTEVIAFSPSDQFCLVEVISCAAEDSETSE